MLKHPHNVTSKRFKFLDIRSEDTLRYHYCFLILIWCTNDSISPSHFCHKLPYLIVRSWSPKVSSGDLCCLLVVIAPFLITPWAVYLCTSETTLTISDESLPASTIWIAYYFVLVDCPPFSNQSDKSFSAILSKPGCQDRQHYFVCRRTWVQCEAAIYCPECHKKFCFRYSATVGGRGLCGYWEE